MNFTAQQYVYKIVNCGSSKFSIIRWMRMPKGLLMLLWCSLAIAAHAQYEEAAIRGTIRDTQGLVIPQARVEIKQSETGLVRSTLTSGAGVFSLSGLPLGVYTFVVSHAGFQEVRVTDIHLAVGQTRTVDVT